MNDSQKLEVLHEMTNVPGWKLLVEDLEARVDALKEGLVNNRSDEYQIGLAQGHIKVYREFINLRVMIDQLQKQYAEEAEDVEADNV
jgi:hypothetical protein